MEELFLETRSGRVHAMAAGEANDPPVLALHGWSPRNGWHTWAPLMEPLAEAGFRVVSVDMPGWGQSPPIHPQPLERDEAIRIVLSILDALGSERDAVLMGKSWGGDLALAIALDHPARVGKLILTAPAFSAFDRLPDLQQPVLLAWAEDDPVIPYRFAEQYRVIPNLRLVTYSTGGHSAAPNNAADFAPIAAAFLNE